MNTTLLYRIIKGIILVILIFFATLYTTVFFAPQLGEAHELNGISISICLLCGVVSASTYFIVTTQKNK